MDVNDDHVEDVEMEVEEHEEPRQRVHRPSRRRIMRTVSPEIKEYLDNNLEDCIRQFKEILFGKPVPTYEEIMDTMNYDIPQLKEFIYSYYHTPTAMRNFFIVEEEKYIISINEYTTLFTNTRLPTFDEDEFNFITQDLPNNHFFKNYNTYWVLLNEYGLKDAFFQETIALNRFDDFEEEHYKTMMRYPMYYKNIDPFYLLLIAHRYLYLMERFDNPEDEDDERYINRPKTILQRQYLEKVLLSSGSVGDLNQRSGSDPRSILRSIVIKSRQTDPPNSAINYIKNYFKIFSILDIGSGSQSDLFDHYCNLNLHLPEELKVDLTPIYKEVFVIIDGMSKNTVRNIIGSILNEYQPTSFYYQLNQFQINFLKTHSNILTQGVFTIEILIQMLDCGQLFTTLRNQSPDIPRFSTADIEMSQEAVAMLATYHSEPLKKAIFKRFDGVFEEINMTRYTRDRRDNERVKQEAKLYFIVKVLEFVNKFDYDIPLDFYLAYSGLYPQLKVLHNNISKESIIKFLERVEPNREVVVAWNNMWALQNPDEVAPPPPDWFIRQHDSSNVHSKSLVEITDCRLKLLLQNFPSPPPIEDIASDIEQTTRRLAIENSKTETFDSEEQKESYIEEHTIKATDILKCRISADEPRYYGFGEIYEQTVAMRLTDDKRVDICNTVSRIWLVIESTKRINLDMYNTLVAQFVGAFKEHINRGVCNQGWVGGLTSIFGTYTKDLGYYCRDEEKEEDDKPKVLVRKFLIDMIDNVEVDYPTINKLFVTISGLLLDAKYDDSWREEFEGDEERLARFEEKVKMYDDLFEPSEDLSVEYRKMTMTHFIECMKPTFFMDAYVKFHEEAEVKEDIVDIKKGVLMAFKEFKEYQLKKIR
jgi:hypothetical protein